MKLTCFFNLLVSVALLFFFEQLVWAQAPQTMSYQALLADANGAAVPDGNYNLTFRLYPTAGGGSALWTESHNSAVSSGISNVILGSKTPLSLSFNNAYWLGVTVGGGTELSPRIALSAFAYSLHAREIADGSVKTSKIANGAVTPTKLSPGGATPGDILTFDGADVIWGQRSPGLTLPFAGTISTGEPAFSATNSGTGMAVRGLSTQTGNLLNYGGYFEATGDHGRAVAGVVNGNQAQGVYGFAVLAMLIPLLSEFDVATGRTSSEKS